MLITSIPRLAHSTVSLLPQNIIDHGIPFWVGAKNISRRRAAQAARHTAPFPPSPSLRARAYASFRCLCLGSNPNSPRILIWSSSNDSGISFASDTFIRVPVTFRRPWLNRWSTSNFFSEVGYLGTSFKTAARVPPDSGWLTKECCTEEVQPAGDEVAQPVGIPLSQVVAQMLGSNSQS